MNIFVLAYAGLILVSLLAVLYTLWAYHHCPSNRSHRPLVFPFICSLAWFLVGVEQLVAYIRRTHGSVDGITMIVLISVTLIALLYFVKHYIFQRHQACPLPSER